MKIGIHKPKLNQLHIYVQIEHFVILHDVPDVRLRNSAQNMAV